MAPRSRGIKRALGAAISPSRNQHVCRSCRQALSCRSYAAAATAQAPTEVPPLEAHTHVHPVTASAASQYTIKAGVVLSRPPLITPDPHPFETAYHLYQRRLNERLVLPFTQYFYFKRGTPAFEEWRKRKTERGGVATRDIGKYNAYTNESWNDEALTGDESGSPQSILEQLIDEEGRSSEFTPEGGDPKTGGLRRWTDADKKSDTKSLERRLSRTLYLLVKTGQQSNPWIFPTGTRNPMEGLREAAKRVLDETCGVNMNTWFVGGHPVGHLVRDPRKELMISEDPAEDKKEDAANIAIQPKVEKTFFMKARIFAGQASVEQQKRTYEDFAWLSKDEIADRVASTYWERVQKMLVAQ